jgi:hypothetical protein
MEVKYEVSVYSSVFCLAEVKIVFCWLESAMLVSEYCNGVDLNCGCPQRWALQAGGCTGWLSCKGDGWLSCSRDRWLSCKGDGLLSCKGVAKLQGRWVAKLQGRWVAKLQGRWVAELQGRWVAEL